MHSERLHLDIVRHNALDLLVHLLSEVLFLISQVLDFLGLLGQHPNKSILFVVSLRLVKLTLVRNLPFLGVDTRFKEGILLFVKFG